MIKRIHVCSVCGLEEEVNRKKAHHVIPRRLNTKSKLRFWLCRGCHSMLHKAEFMGLCRLPSSEKEHKDWLYDMSRWNNNDWGDIK